MTRKILFTKQDCEKCHQLLVDCCTALEGFERFDVETEDGIVELCSYDLFGEAERWLPIIVCEGKIAKGYVQCKQLLDSQKWQNIKLGE